MDFTQPWHSGDITFVIEDRKIYVNKGVLAMASAVFRAMFQSDFAEKKMAEIPLPGKKFDDFLQLMQIIEPLSDKCVDDTNVEILLPLAHEYQITKVVKRCENVLLKQAPSLHNLILADKFSLADLRKVFFEHLKTAKIKKIRNDPDFRTLDQATCTEVLEHHAMHQKASINNLFLAEKYDVPEVYEKCLKYLKDTPLSKLKVETGFANLKPETLIEVLTFKAERLEELKLEITNLSNWGPIGQQENCTYTSPWEEQQYYGYPVEHIKGCKESCHMCCQHRIKEMGKVVKKY